MSSSDNNKVSDAITDEAAAWFQLMRAGKVSTATRGRFADWLAASPLHAAEYLQLTELWADLGDIDAGSAIDVQALSDAADNNVEALFSGALAGSKRRKRRLRWSAGIAAAVAVLAGFLWLGSDVATEARYATARGEQRSFSLDDGSLIHLNTQSSILVNFSKDTRRVELLQGEALFDVASDPARPFTVSDNHLVAQALGTHFNVYRRRIGTRVTVLEGTVAVSAQANGGVGISPQSRIRLSPGEQVSVAKDRKLTKLSVNVERVTAWTARRLVFEEDALRDVVDEFNRYNQTELRLGSEALAREEINGSFNADNPGALVEVLGSLFGVESSRQPDGSLLLTYAADRR